MLRSVPSKKQNNNKKQNQKTTQQQNPQTSSNLYSGTELEKVTTWLNSECLLYNYK